MWAEAAKWLAKFPDVVVTALDEDGYPISVREATSAYDAAIGELPVRLAETLRPTEGPAGLLCHRHDEKLWNQSAIQVKGSLLRREDDWLFVSSAFTPPSRLAAVQTIKRVRASSDRYLAKRGLEPPVVNWTSVADIWRRARSAQQ
jgi:hypothetical protein